MNASMYYENSDGHCLPAWGISLEPGRVCILTDDGVMWEGTVHMHHEGVCCR